MRFFGGASDEGKKIIEDQPGEGKYQLRFHLKSFIGLLFNMAVKMRTNPKILKVKMQ